MIQSENATIASTGRRWGGRVCVADEVVWHFGWMRALGRRKLTL